MATSDQPYWIALAHCLKLGPTRFALLRKAFATMAEAWAASLAAWHQAGLDPATIKALDEHRRVTNVDEVMKNIKSLGLNALTIVDNDYPKLLKEIYDPPAVFFYRGSLTCLEQPCLAVVGTRRATAYGLRATTDITSKLASAGVTIISGLAYGIDAAAHQATLSAHGHTAAVLANGLDTIYPSAHTQLAHGIVSTNGLLISEFPPQTPALKQNFVQRNRIIAGLARATLVIEGARESGALITARFALESNREVLALPGSIFNEQSQGTNDLLKSGAHLVTSVNDVLEVLGLQHEKTTPIIRRPLLEDENDLLQKLSTDAIHIDELARNLAIPIAQLAAKLTALELAGYVQDEGSQRYIRVG